MAERLAPIPITPSIQQQWAADEGGALADVIGRRRAWLMCDTTEARLLLVSIDQHVSLRRHDDKYTEALERVGDRLRQAVAPARSPRP